MQPCEILEENYSRIERVVAAVCRRRCVFDAEAEDMRQEVLLKLAADDCAALRGLSDTAVLESFVDTVTTRVVIDEIRRHKGRWRPSVAARSLGKPAIMLETLLFRDGWDYEMAASKLVAEGVADSVEEVDRLRVRLPEHRPRTFVGEEQLRHQADAGGVESRVKARERQRIGQVVEEAVAEVRSEISSVDWLLLQRVFCDRRTIVQASQELGLPLRPTYRRCEKLLEALRKAIGSRGLTWEEAEELMGWGELDFGWGEGRDDIVE